MAARRGPREGKRPPPPPRETAENLAVTVAWLWCATACLPLAARLPGAIAYASPALPFFLGAWVFFTARRPIARRLGAVPLLAAVAVGLWLYILQHSPE